MSVVFHVDEVAAIFTEIFNYMVVKFSGNSFGIGILFVTTSVHLSCLLFRKYAQMSEDERDRMCLKIVAKTDAESNKCKDGLI